MKAIKKLAAVLAAATVTVGVMAVSAFAEGSTYSLYVQAEEGSVGDIVSMSVILDSNEDVGVGSFSFKLNYDPEELELQNGSIVIGDALSGWITGDDEGYNAKDGSISLAYVTMGKGIRTTNVELLTASFKVLKANSTITLTDVDLAADDMDGTDLNNDVTVNDEVTVKCSHKNTETKTDIEDCAKGGKATTTCKDCGEVVKTEDVAPTEHTVDKWTVTKEATCTETGEEEGTCSVCGKTVTHETDMVDHTYGEWKVTTPATCTEAGVETRECAVCGELENRLVEALGHDWGEWTVTKEATCTEEGTEERVCSRCDEKETRGTGITPHDYEWTVTKEATCTEAGEQTGTCKICGNEVKEEIVALGHAWGEWKVVEKATTEKEGSEERECSRCGEKETRVIDKLAPAESDNTTSSDPDVTTSSDESGNNGSINNGGSNNGSSGGNPATGVALAVIPLVAAGAAVIVFSKKRK